MATRPNNEERRAQAVVKTGLIDAPNSDLFQIYCDLAKDLTGYEQAKFSLFDGESQCSMGAAGVDDSYEVGAKTERSPVPYKVECLFLCSFRMFNRIF